MKKAYRDLAATQRHLWKLQKEVSRGVTGVLVFLLRCLDYLAYVEEFYKTQITTAMQISRISQYHNVQNGEGTLFKTCRTKYDVAVCWNRLIFVKEHLFRYHYLIVLNFMLYYINEHRIVGTWSRNMQCKTIVKTITYSYSKDIIGVLIKIWMIRNVPHNNNNNMGAYIALLK